MQTVPVHATILHDLPVHVVPGPRTARILLPITPHGRPAGEQWRGEPGVVFACRTGSSPAVRGRATPCRRTVPKTGAPRRFRLTILTYQRRKPSRGPLACDNRIFRRRLGVLAPRRQLWNTLVLFCSESDLVLPKTRRSWPQTRIAGTRPLHPGR